MTQPRGSILKSSKDSPFHGVKRIRSACHCRRVNDIIFNRNTNVIACEWNDLHDLHPVFGERPRLIYTQNGCRAECLNDWNPPGKHLGLGESPRANRQKNREDNWKLRRNHRHPKAYSCQNSF